MTQQHQHKRRALACGLAVIGSALVAVDRVVLRGPVATTIDAKQGATRSLDAAHFLLEEPPAPILLDSFSAVGAFGSSTAGSISASSLTLPPESFHGSVHEWNGESDDDDDEEEEVTPTETKDTPCVWDPEGPPSLVVLAASSASASAVRDYLWPVLSDLVSPPSAPGAAPARYLRTSADPRAPLFLVAGDDDNEDAEEPWMERALCEQRREHPGASLVGLLVVGEALAAPGRAPVVRFARNPLDAGLEALLAAQTGFRPKDPKVRLPEDYRAWAAGIAEAAREEAEDERDAVSFADLFSSAPEADWNTLLDLLGAPPVLPERLEEAIGTALAQRAGDASAPAREVWEALWAMAPHGDLLRERDLGKLEALWEGETAGKLLRGGA